MYSGPVQEIEYQKEKGKEDQEGEVRHGVRVLLPPEAVELPELHLEEDAGVLHEGGKHEHDAADHPHHLITKSRRRVIRPGFT